MSQGPDRPWKLSFAGWSPRPPADERSPWAYLPGLSPESTFETCDAAIHAIESVPLTDEPGEVRPLFWPIRELFVSE
jgi:hypothetical protein